METGNCTGKKTAQKSEVEFKWALRLAREFRHICLSRKIVLETPIIRISGAENTFGSWDPEGRVLSVSRCLIENHPWDMVLEVLKHEIAHQYVSEVYRETDAHGGMFSKACDRLGVHPVFRTPTADPEKALSVLADRVPSNARQILQKVEKLFALARSDNEKEAESASRKAAEILGKYNLEQAARKGSTEPEVVFRTICHKKKRIKSIQKSITALLIRYYFVQAVLSSTYDPLDDTEYKTVVLIGRKENLTVAEYVYHFLYRTAARLWQEYRKSNKAGPKEKNSFDAGFMKGIRDNHARTAAIMQNQNTGTGSKALPVKTANGLVERIEKENLKERDRLFPRLRSDVYGRHKPGCRAFQAGADKGKNTRIRKGIH
ncbi:MAG: SprT-like domain-containing protein, partial [Thermodesulfobacteriota bacterium]